MGGGGAAARGSAGGDKPGEGADDIIAGETANGDLKSLLESKLDAIGDLLAASLESLPEEDAKSLGGLLFQVRQIVAMSNVDVGPVPYTDLPGNFFKMATTVEASSLLLSRDGKRSMSAGDAEDGADGRSSNSGARHSLGGGETQGGSPKRNSDEGRIQLRDMQRKL